MALWVYPPDGHKTDSKSIFVLGSVERSAKLNGMDLALTNGNFAEQVKLKLGENLLEMELDGKRETRLITGIPYNSTSLPIAYARAYDAFALTGLESKNILRAVTVSKTKISIPLTAPPKINLEQVANNHYRLYLLAETGRKLGLSDDTKPLMAIDLDWVHYLSLQQNIVIKPNKEAVLDIYTSSPSTITAKWVEFELLLSISQEKGVCSSVALTTDFKKICLDPGHGGSQLGTQSPKGVCEKDLNLNLALKLAGELKSRDLEIVMTRNSDIDVSLPDRVKIAKESDADLFISVHHNALPDARDPKAEQGISVHYYHERDRELATYILEALITKTKLPLHGLFRQNLHVLRENSSMPAILIEFGFLIHPEESEIITKNTYQELVATILAQLIANKN